MMVNRDLQWPEKVFVTSEVEPVKASDVQIENNIIIGRQKIFGSWCNYESVIDSIMTPACLGQRQDGEADGWIHIVELEKEVGALCSAQPKVAGDCQRGPAMCKWRETMRSKI